MVVDRPTTGTGWLMGSGNQDSMCAWPTRRRLNNTRGLKHSDDGDDAVHLAHLMRLGVLAQGYIYPKAQRAVRDLLRKRSQLVRQRTANVLAIENLVARNSGRLINGNQVKRLTEEELVSSPRARGGLPCKRMWR